MVEKLFKVVSQDRESYMAEFLNQQYRPDEYILDSFLDLLRFLRFHGFIKKYNIGDVVEPRKETVGIFAYKTFYGAEQSNNLNLKGHGKIIEIEPIGHIIEADQYSYLYVKDMISSMDLEGFKTLVRNGKVDHGKHSVFTTGVIAPKVRVLT
jgi:hypothetical protein